MATALHEEMAMKSYVMTRQMIFTTEMHAKVLKDRLYLHTSPAGAVGLSQVMNGHTNCRGLQSMMT